MKNVLGNQQENIWKYFIFIFIYLFFALVELSN